MQPLNPKPSKQLLAGRAVKITNHGLSACWVKAALRLSQVANEPGVYPATIIVRDDGVKELVINGGKVERLGK
jgi:hypothetical protein